jgi:hypothetical protein
MNNYRYVDFRRGLARIDDFTRDYKRDERSAKGVTSLAHEAADFVLEISGGEYQSPGPFSLEEEDTTRNRGGDERLKQFESVVDAWCALGDRLSSIRSADLEGNSEAGTLKLKDGACVVPPPWILADAYNRFRTNSEELASLPWRQHTVGTMLERHSMAFWNALLQKELQYRIDQRQVTEELRATIDYGLVRDGRRAVTELQASSDESGPEWKSDIEAPHNAFTRNVNSITSFWKSYESREGESLFDVIPYTIYWMCCPFLLTVVSKEAHNECIVGDHTELSKPDPSAGEGFLQTAYHSSMKESEYSDRSLTASFMEYLKKFSGSETATGDRPEWQKSSFNFSQGESHDFDIHDIMCGIARADSPGSSQTEKDKDYIKKFGL